MAEIKVSELANLKESKSGDGWSFNAVELNLGNNSTHADITFTGSGDVNYKVNANNATILADDVTFTGRFINADYAGSGYTIKSGTFTNVVENGRVSIIDGGTFKNTVNNFIGTNGGTIRGGTFKNVVNNMISNSKIEGGTFEKKVTNSSGSITYGVFEDEVTNSSFTARIDGGIFRGTVTNENKGKINGGNFSGTITNNGTINKITVVGDITINGSNSIGNITATSGDITIAGSGTIDTVEVTSGNVSINATIGAITITSGDVTISNEATLNNITSITVGVNSKINLPTGTDIKDVTAKISGEGTLVIDNKEYKTDGTSSGSDSGDSSGGDGSGGGTGGSGSSDGSGGSGGGTGDGSGGSTDSGGDSGNPSTPDPQPQPDPQPSPVPSPSPAPSPSYSPSTSYTNQNSIDLSQGSQTASISATNSYKMITGSNPTATLNLFSADDTGANASIMNATLSTLNATASSDIVSLTNSHVGMINAGFGLDTLLLDKNSKVDFAFGFNAIAIQGSNGAYSGFGAIASGQIAMLNNPATMTAIALYGAQAGSYFLADYGINSQLYTMNSAGGLELVATLNGSYVSDAFGNLISTTNMILI